MKLRKSLIWLAVPALILAACQNAVKYSGSASAQSTSCGSGVYDSQAHSCKAKLGQDINNGLSCGPLIEDVQGSTIQYDPAAEECVYPVEVISDNCHVEQIGVSPIVGGTGGIMDVMVCDTGTGSIGPGEICTQDANEYGYPSHCQCMQLGAPNMVNEYNPKTGKCEIRHL